MPERVGEVSAYREADTKEAGGKRRRWPDAVKRELVAATLEPGGGHSVGSQINNAKAGYPKNGRRPPNMAGISGRMTIAGRVLWTGKRLQSDANADVQRMNDCGIIRLTD